MTKKEFLERCEAWFTGKLLDENGAVISPDMRLSIKQITSGRASIARPKKLVYAYRVKGRIIISDVRPTGSVRYKTVEIDIDDIT